MKILLLGAKGMLGQDLARVFRSHKLLAMDRGELNICDESAVRKAMADFKPHAVINTAAYNAVDKAEEESEQANRVNGHAVESLAGACLMHDSLLVHYSTGYVFKGDNESGYAEDDEPDPVNAYGKSKLLGEQAILDCDNLRYHIIRTSRLFGAPASSSTAKKSFVDAMLELAGRQKEIRVVDEEEDSPTHTPELAMKTRDMLESHTPNGIYHVTNAGACTWYEFAREIFRLSGKEVSVVPVPASEFPRPAERPKYCKLINTKLPSMRPWQEALKDYLRTIGPSG